MASSIVGILKVLLTAETGEFKSGLGEASKATKQFSGQMTGMATQVGTLSKAFGAMFTVGALTAAASKVMDYAGKISDLAEQTGLTTESIQEMAHAARQSGSSLESFTNAAFKLGMAIAGGSNSVVGAIERLGLSYDALKAMSPDDQFKAIGAALKEVQDIQERNRLGVILMGRGYKEVAGAINEGYDELARNAAKSSAEQIRALKEAGDEWDRFKDKVMNVGVMIGGSFAKSMAHLGTALKQDWEFIQKHTVDRVTQALDDWRTIFGHVAEGPKVLGSALKSLPAPLGAATLSIEEQAEAAKKLDKQLADLASGHKASAKAAEEYAEAEAERLEALKVRGRLEASIAEENERFRAEAIAGIDAEKRAWRDYYNWLGERRMEDEDRTQSFREALSTTMNLSAMFEPFKGSVTQNLPNISQWSKAWSSMTEGLKVALATIPGTLARAFEGGGNIWGAIKSIGSQIGSIIGASFGTSETGKAIGAAIGSLVGPLMQGFKKLFGIGVNDQIKRFNKEIDASREALLKQFGSLERIQRLGKAVGIDLAGAWQHQGAAGKKAFEELATEFQKRVAQMESDLDGFKGDLESAIDEAREMGYVFDSTGEFVSVRFEKMQQLAEEFGVDVAALGPTFQNARIQETAAKYLNAIELLAKGGTDAGTILVGMKDELSKLVQDAQAAKTTLPEQFRPWIAELIRSGQLLMANGDAITDIGQIQFGAAIETQWERITKKIGDLITKIDDLINTLRTELTPALDAAARDRTVHFGISHDPIPNFGDAVAGFGPHLATGTKGLFGDWFANFPKTGMSAMLHGMEAVVTPQQAPAFALDVLGANAGFAQSQQKQSTSQPIVVRNITENNLFIDGQKFKTWITDQVTKAIENNERGLRSNMRDALGIV